MKLFRKNLQQKEEMKRFNKKGQEEIVGFLLIVLIIVIMGVVFLFFFKPAATESRDFQLDNLLVSMIGTTVDGKTVSDRIENCEQGVECDVLQNDLNNMTDIVFRKMGFTLGRNIVGYNLTISQGMSYSNSAGNVTYRGIASVTVVRNSLVKLKFYY